MLNWSKCVNSENRHRDIPWWGVRHLGLGALHTNDDAEPPVEVLHLPDLLSIWPLVE